VQGVNTGNKLIYMFAGNKVGKPSTPLDNATLHPCVVEKKNLFERSPRLGWGMYPPFWRSEKLTDGITRWYMFVWGQTPSELSEFSLDQLHKHNLVLRVVGLRKGDISINPHPSQQPTIMGRNILKSQHKRRGYLGHRALTILKTKRTSKTTIEV